MSIEIQRNGESGTELRISIKLTPEETDSLGGEAELIAEIIDTYFWAVTMLRTGVNHRDLESPPPTAGDWYVVLKEIDRLPPRLNAVRDAVVRTFIDSGGSLERMAKALDVSHDDARQLLSRILGEGPSGWEEKITSQ